MDEAAESGQKNSGKQKWIAIASGLTLVVALSVGIVLWQSQRPRPLLPTSITDSVQDFTPYFYTRQVPAGYSIDQVNIRYAAGVLIVPLTKPNNPAITLNEQAIPKNVSDSDIQQNGEHIEVAAGPATINDVEGRLVGTLITSERTLILLNAPGDASKDDITKLLQQLTPIK